MGAAMQILAEIRNRGARAWIEGDRLLVSPSKALDPDLRERIRQAKPAVLELLRAAPPELALSARGREALGSKAVAPSAPLVSAPPEQRSAWLQKFLEDASYPLCVIDHGLLGRLVLVRNPKALEALEEEDARLPMLSTRELHELDAHGIEAVRVLVETRRVFGPQVELRALRSRPLDG